MRECEREKPGTLQQVLNDSGVWSCEEKKLSSRIPIWRQEQRINLKLSNENSGRKGIYTELQTPLNALLLNCLGKGWIQTGANVKLVGQATSELPCEKE